jgi:predicted permease
MFSPKAIFEDLRSFLQRHKIRREIEEELRLHGELLIEENISSGMSPEEAKQDALKRFGNIKEVRDVCFEIRSSGINALIQDIGLAFGLILGKPLFTTLSVLTLALSIAGAIAVFSIINAVLLQPIPYKEADRLVKIQEKNVLGVEVDTSNLNFLDIKRRNQSFEHVVSYSGGNTTITGGKEPTLSYVAYVSRDFFELLGVEPILGRTLLPKDHRQDATAVIVVSYNFWLNQLGSAKDLTHKELFISGKSYTIAGILPPNTNFPAKADIWIPRELFSDNSSRSAHNLKIVAKKRSGVTLDQARTELSYISQQFESEYPDSNTGQSFTTISLQDHLTSESRPTLLVLLFVSSLILLVACFNVTNLLLIREGERQREIVSRIKIGASRFRISRQLLIECVLLSFIGTILGLILSFAIKDILLNLTIYNVNNVINVNINGEVLAFAFGMSLLTGLLCGVIPVLQVAQIDDPEMVNEEEQNVKQLSFRSRGFIVSIELALTMILLVTTGLYAKNLWHLYWVNPGFDPNNVLTAQISLPQSDYKDEHSKLFFYRQILERIRRIPDVKLAGVINNLPLRGEDINGTFHIEENPLQEYHAGFRLVSPDYFQSLAIPLLQGQFFTEQDKEDSTPVTLISRNLAEKTWSQQNPIGRRIRFIGMDLKSEIWMTVIGVVGDVKHDGMDSPFGTEVYVPYSQRPFRSKDMSIVVRTIGNPEDAMVAVRNEIQSVDKNLPIKFETMRQVLSGSFVQKRNRVILSTISTFAIIILSMTGFYIVIRYEVSSRLMNIKKIAHRFDRNLVYYSLMRSLSLALAGIITGSVAVFTLSQITGLLLETKPMDPVIFLITSAIILISTLFISYITACREVRRT